MQLTAIIEQGENGWLNGHIEEVPAIISQGRTVEEVKTQLRNSFGLLQALNLLPTQPQPTPRSYVNRTVIREALDIAD